MDINGIDFHLFTNHSSRGSDIVNVEKSKMTATDYDHSVLFVNYAEIAWQEMRRAWRGDQSIASQIKPREPMRHCSSTIKEELLSSNEPFDGPVPLSKMVQFLVEVWEDDLQD